MILDLGDDTLYPMSWTSEDVVFGTYTRGGKTRIGALDLSDPSSIHVVSDEESLPALAPVDVSPDGRWLAWISAGSSVNGAFVSSIVTDDGVPALGRGRQRIPVDSPSWIAWSRQGDEIFLLGGGRTVYSVSVSATAGELQIGTPQELFRTPSPPLLNHLSVSPDGQRFYFVIEPNAPRRTLRVVLNWKTRLAD